MYGFSIFYRNKENPFSDHVVKFPLQCQAAEGGNSFGKIRMAVDLKLSPIGIFFHGSSNHADHPYDPQNVIRVLMGHENMVDMRKIHIHFFQNLKDSVSASGVDHKKFILIF